MSRPFRQFIAVLLAVSLPPFSANALAAAVVMQSSGAASHAAVATHDTAHADSRHQMAGMDDCAMYDGSADTHTAPDTTCKHSATCHLACSGFVATGSLDVALPVSPDNAVTPYSASFQSRSVAPLDTPPLARI
jgi:hypothetical protein